MFYYFWYLSECLRSNPKSVLIVLMRSGVFGHFRKELANFILRWERENRVCFGRSHETLSFLQSQNLSSLFTRFKTCDFNKN